MDNKKIKKYVTVALMFLLTGLEVSAQYGPYDIATASGNYDFSYSQAPGNLVPVKAANTGTSYTWEKSTTPLFTGTITTVAATASFNVSSPLTQTTYYRRKTTIIGGAVIISNIIELRVVSQNWEDINYVREHDILISGQTDWKTIDQLPIGQKLQTTTYLDGLGRAIEKVSRGTAAPQDGGSQWGDQVQFSTYDSYGRQNKEYLPYTTTTDNPGKFKSDPLTAETAYYGNPNTYNETSAYSSVTFDNSPLNRVTNIKDPGTSWAAGPGNSADYSLNDAADNVQQFKIDYTTGSLPVLVGAYPAYTLMKTTHTDENGKKVIEYTNSLGQLVLTKTEVNDTHTNAYDGWICTYSVYDDFGLLRFRMQPEAVKWLYAHSWSFAGTDGPKVADGLCFRYEYDDKGRNILKKAPGAKALNMIYDGRDRVVFMQDGNQAAKTTPEWTANLYDDLDRLTLTTLYKTTKTSAQLQTDIDNSATVSTVTINNPAQPVVNLVLDKPETVTVIHEAQQSIELNPGFEFQSSASNTLTAQINTTTSQSINVTTVTYHDPISQADLNNTTVCTPVKYLFYDDYSFTAVKPFDNSFDNLQAYPNGTDVMPIVTSKRTIGFATGSLVRVLGTNTFLAATVYYDEKGRQVQSIDDNIKSGKDVTSLQYHWDGRLLSSNTKHTTAGSGYSSFSIITKNIFDKIGRVVSIQKKYGSNAFKTIAAYDLDDMGRLKTKHLDPDYTPPGGGATGLESLDYTYNIHNNITGINKDYALKTSGKYDKWGHYFGLYLGYDNRDAVFNAGKLDGHVTGLLWNTQGDDNQRKYDYTYDNAGRLTKADFREKKTPGDAWNNSKLDFSTGGTGTGGAITYDLNGNLLSMLQKGVVVGGAGPATVDNLTYAYASFSNQLRMVSDNGTLGSTNGMLGDFKDGTNGGDDYFYDDNGNLVLDLNKNVTGVTGGVATPIGTTGITYNFLDKPELINISGKGTIKILYDVDGNKLQRTFTPTGGTAKVTTYINEFVYQGDALQYINFEEGRIRVMTPVSQNNGYDGLAIDGNIDLPGGSRGAFDYFIRDYQQNVRMILTEETHYGINECTMELNRAGNEEPYFGQTGSANEVATTRLTKPPGWNSNTSTSVSKLSKLTGHTIGPNSLLKVMAGDVINARADYYYPAQVTNNNKSLVTDIVAALVNAISGSPVTPTSVHGNTANISNDLSAVGSPFASAMDPDQAAGDQIPRAYLNVVFFNERFEFVGEGSTAVRVSQAGDGADPLVLPLNTKAPKNGYAYIYLSNENDDAVYFDNFTVSDTRGRIIEENHYYAFGLKIAGISSKKLGDPNEGMLDNKNLYNDKELFDDADLDWYDYGFRNYDPQIGRFTQLDPLTDDYPELTNYQYASDEPIANVDMDGLEAYQTLEPVIIKASIKSASKATGLATKVIERLSLITARGVSDALVNANTFGLSDLMGNNHLDSYENPDDKAAYLRGRIGGDALAAAQGSSEVEGGTGAALTTGIVTGGVGAAAGLFIGLHGAGVGGTAAYDAAWALKKLYQLDASANDASSSASSGNTSSGSNWKKEPPAFAKDAKWAKNSEGKWGWKDKKGNFVTKGDKPGEWHVNPNPNNRNPLWNGQKPRRTSKQPYWNVNNNGIITH
jgi:RHS repeat-associated protein